MRVTIHKQFRWPDGARMAFAIRDDDTSYFTIPNMLETIYGEAWRKDFRVSLAVIPVHRGVQSPNVNPKFRTTNKNYPIYNNRKLVEYLRIKIARDEVDILQHGYSHSCLSARDIAFAPLYGHPQPYPLFYLSEFHNIDEKTIRRRVGEGKRILEQVFNSRIEGFVAPQEYLTKALWRTLLNEGMFYCGVSNMMAIPLSQIHACPLLENVLRKLLNYDVYPYGICDISPLPHLIPIYRHYSRGFINEGTSNAKFEEFKKLFEKTFKRRSFFILVNHYWEYFFDWSNKMTQDRQFEYLTRILQYADKHPIWKCSLTELYKYIYKNDELLDK